MLINIYSVDWLNALVKKIEKKIERIDHEAAFAIRFGRPGALIMSFIGIDDNDNELHMYVRVRQGLYVIKSHCPNLNRNNCAHHIYNINPVYSNRNNCV